MTIKERTNNYGNGYLVFDGMGVLAQEVFESIELRIADLPLTATLNRKFLREMLDGQMVPVPATPPSPQQCKFLNAFRALMNRPFRISQPKSNAFLLPCPMRNPNFGRTSSGMTFSPRKPLPPGDLRTRVDADLRLLGEQIQVKWDQRKLERGTATAKAGSRKTGRL